MDPTLGHFSNQVAADGDALLLKISTMCRRRVESIERSSVRIARSGQLMAESDRRTNARKAVRAPIRAANIKRGLISDLIERVRQTRARSELILGRTREVIARSRALLIEPI